MTGFTAADVPDQSGRTIIVTGANTGIGFEAARALASKGARVLLGCRSEDKARGAIERIRKAFPQADCEFLPLDQADLDSVRRAAEIAAREPRLDVLLNNAGVMMPPLGHTADGFETQFGVNHLGTFALTALLLPKLAETAASRVVVTASLAHRRGRIAFDNLDGRKGYKRGDFYAQSKLANLLFVYELDRRLRATNSPVTALACHPGVAQTDLMRHFGPLEWVVAPVFGFLLNSAAQGAWPALQAATAPDVVRGGYYGPQALGGARGASGLAERTPSATNPEVARQLWEVSEDLTGIEFGVVP